MSELFKRWLWRKTQARAQATGPAADAADKAAVPAAGGAAPRLSSASDVSSEGGEARDNEQGELRAQPLLPSAGPRSEHSERSHLIPDPALAAAPVLPADQPALSADQPVLSADQPAPSSESAASAQPAKSALPDRATLRAMFRSHQPDGLDDYTQDFSQPELLPAALTAGLRHWLVDQAMAPATASASAQGGQPCEPDHECAVAGDLAAIETPSPPVNAQQSMEQDRKRDILTAKDGQNVAISGDAGEHLGS